jgi:hypothetical protein
MSGKAAAATGATVTVPSSHAADKPVRGSAHT